MKKVEHDIKCDKCGKVATHSVESIWRSYGIDEEGNYNEEREWEGNDIEHYCDDCYED